MGKTPTRKAKGLTDKRKSIVETPVNTRKEVLTRSGRRTRASSKEILDVNEPLINSGKRTRASGKVDSAETLNENEPLIKRARRSQVDTPKVLAKTDYEETSDENEVSFRAKRVETDTPKAANNTPKASVKTPKDSANTPETAANTPKAGASTPTTASSTPKTAASTPNTAANIPKAATKTPKAAAKTPKTAAKTPKNVVKTTKAPPMNTHKALVETPSASNDTLETSIDKGTILKDICVYVDVQAKNEDRSDVVVKKVLTLGAKVSKSLGKQCSHMVFKEGNLTTYNKAKSLGLFIVSVNWVEACEKENKVVDEKLYPTMNKEKYEKEVLPGVTPKLTRRRSLQPKTDEEFSKQIDAKLSRRSSANNSKISEESSAETSKETGTNQGVGSEATISKVGSRKRKMSKSQPKVNAFLHGQSVAMKKWFS